MTPLVNNAVPGAAAVNTVWSAVVVPELLSYTSANGSTVVTSGATAIPGPIYRGIWAASGRFETSSGTFSTGAIALYELCLDGNWHQVTGPVTLAASSQLGFSIGQGSNSGNSAFPYRSGVPFLGLALVMTTALTGGGTLTYTEIKTLAEPIDPRYSFPMPLGRGDTGLFL
jgi:hypothetical protein